MNAVAPGPVWTPLNPADAGATPEKVAEFGKDTPIGRPAQPEELSPAYVFLASTPIRATSRAKSSPTWAARRRRARRPVDEPEYGNGHEHFADREAYARSRRCDGALAGVGRAVVREFARAGAWLGLVARGRDGLEGARREVEELADGPSCFRWTSPMPKPWTRAAERVEHELGPIDVWVNDAMVSVFSPVARSDRRRLPARDRGDLPGRGPRHPRGAQTHAPARSRHDRAGGLGPGLSRHSPSIGLLRCQARDPGLHRIAPMRTHSRQQPGQGHDGAAPRGQYASVRLVEIANAAQGPARSSDLSAGGTGSRDLPRGSPLST